MFQALLVIICKLFQKHQITPVVEPLDVLSFRKQRNFANNEAVNSFFTRKIKLQCIVTRFANVDNLDFVGNLQKIPYIQACNM